METPHLTGYSSSTEDIVHGESRLREDLADAMLETTATHGTGESILYLSSNCKGKRWV